MSPHLLHVFSTFAPGGPQVRTVQLIDALSRWDGSTHRRCNGRTASAAERRPGVGWRHSILAMDGCRDARELLGDDAEVEILDPLPKRGTLRTVRALRGLLRRRRPDLLLTYNWGAIEAVMAGRIAGRIPTLHHEDGFLPDELAGYKRRRVWTRRLVLRWTRGVIVPSRNLYGIATELWKLSGEKAHLIPNGIHLGDFPAFPENEELRRELGVPADAVLIGGVGHLRGEKNPVRLVEALGAMSGKAHVLLLGDGPERAAVERRRDELDLADRVHLPGHRERPQPYYAAMDVFAIPSDTEQMPVALLEAMASGLPVVSTDVGDVRHMLPEEQQALVIPLSGPTTSHRLAAALDTLVDDATLRTKLGRANRERVEERYSFPTMLEAYRALYNRALS